MAEQYWSVRCTATRTNGLPCRHWAIVGGFVCQSHGGRAPQVRAAAERRWMFELIARETERDAELRLGRPLDDVEKAVIRFMGKPDPATYRPHVRTRDADPD